MKYANPFPYSNPICVVCEKPNSALNREKCECLPNAWRFNWKGLLVLPVLLLGYWVLSLVFPIPEGLESAYYLVPEDLNAPIVDHNKPFSCDGCIFK